MANPSLFQKEEMKNESNNHEGQINDFSTDVNLKIYSHSSAGSSWSEPIIYQCETALSDEESPWLFEDKKDTHKGNIQ